MYQVTMAAVQPLSEHIQSASIPTDPAVVTVYILLLGSAWLVWVGNRNSGASGEGSEPDVPSDAGSDADSTGEGDASGRSHTKANRKLTRAQRRRRGSINWIQ